MKYTELGNSKIKISKFALGTWPFAGGDLWGEQDDSDSIEAVNESIENGINFFDRLIYKAVPDFIDFHVGNFHWFIFSFNLKPA